MEPSIFVGTLDRYNGITIDSVVEPCAELDFSEKFNNSLNKWTQEKRRCIWFKVNIKDACWVSVLASKGFNFHHARDDFVMMYKWLPSDSVPNLPPACHTNLGVGGMVFNDKNQILVVSELHYEYPHWKLPGGYVERGEDIIKAAIREVKEETGVDAEFQTLVTLRHTHNMMFGNSDIYVVVMMKAASVDIVKSDAEIKECKWMDIEDYLKHPHVHEFNRFLVKQALDCKNRKIKLNIKKEVVKISNWSRDISAMVIEDL